MAAFCWMLIAWKELVSAPRLQWNVHTTVFGLLAGGGSASAGAPNINETDTAAATEIARMSFMTPSLRPRTYILETPGRLPHSAYPRCSATASRPPGTSRPGRPTWLGPPRSRSVAPRMSSSPGVPRRCRSRRRGRVSDFPSRSIATAGAICGRPGRCRRGLFSRTMCGMQLATLSARPDGSPGPG
jgi:hypothetical protein